jgi:hypothetical protein
MVRGGAPGLHPAILRQPTPNVLVLFGWTVVLQIQIPYYARQKWAGSVVPIIHDWKGIDSPASVIAGRMGFIHAA